MPSTQLTCEINNGVTRVMARADNGHYHLEFATRLDDGAWRTVLGTAAHIGTSIWDQNHNWFSDDPTILWTDESGGHQASDLFSGATVDPAGHVMTLSGTRDCHAVILRIEMTNDDLLHVTVTDRVSSDAGPVALQELWSRLYFMPDGKADRYAEPLDFAWLPALHRKEEHICSDHFFRSPTAIVASDGLYAALVPDLDLFGKHCDLPHALDLRVTGTRIEAPQLSYGLCPATLDGHVYFRIDRDHPIQVEGKELVYGFDLFVGSTDAPQQVANKVVSHLWNRYGHREIESILPQVMPFEDYGRRYTYQYELPQMARSTTIEGATCYGLDNAHRRGANFHAWENDLNVAYGIRYYGNKWGSGDLQSIADGILNLSLKAPRSKGAFPCVYNFQEKTYEGSLFWTARSADPIHGYDSAAMSVTAWWQLYWQRDLGTDNACQDALLAYGEFLAASQEPSGAIPTYFFADLSPAKQLRESATTAISGAVLARLAMETQRQDFQEAAMAAGRYVMDQIVPGLVFNDFEAFYSCSPKPLHAIDYWTGIHPHCNLSVQWACDQMLALYELTGEQHWLETGEYLLSILSLYQQVWNPSHLPGYLYGGFGVMNTDGEWNDGRQARFVPTYADYFRATGKLEYLERAVAACRSSFALMDMPENHENAINDVLMKQAPGLGYAPENIHHSGANTGYSWTGMNWSAGGGLAASAYLEHHFGDVWVDVATRETLPLNGVRVVNANWLDDGLELEVESALRDLDLPYQEAQTVCVRIANLPPQGLRITCNGAIHHVTGRTSPADIVTTV